MSILVVSFPVDGMVFLQASIGLIRSFYSLRDQLFRIRYQRNLTDIINLIGEIMEKG